jgi:hypothetical protein
MCGRRVVEVRPNFNWDKERAAVPFAADHAIRSP